MSDETTDETNLQNLDFAVVQQRITASVNSKPLPITPLVRNAVVAMVTDESRFTEFLKHYQEGSVTGNAQVDVYLLAQAMIHDEYEAGRVELGSAIERGSIRLSDVVKRMAPELKKLGFDVKRGKIFGMLEAPSGA